MSQILKHYLSNLSSSFSNTELDLEDSGPINEPQYGHTQNYTPKDTYKDSPEGVKNSTRMEDEGFGSAEEMDLENNGPKNEPIYGHTQIYTPQNTYMDSIEASKVEGTSNQETKGFDGGKFYDNELDLENNGPKNEPIYGHTQNYTPDETYLKTILELGGDEETPLESEGYNGTYRAKGYTFENYDIEDNEPERIEYNTKIGEENITREVQPYYNNHTYLDKLKDLDLSTRGIISKGSKN